MRMRGEVGMTVESAVSHLENMKWLKGYDNTTVGNMPLCGIIDDIIALLKEHEPIKPNEYDPVIYGTQYTCGACKHKIYRNENYCHNCGRPVKWDG